MMNAVLRLIYAIWLSTFLTVAQPVWATGLSCAELFTTKSGSNSITEFINKSGLFIELAAQQRQRKSVVLAPVNSWGRGENAKQLFVIAMRVRSSEEGFTFFNQLVGQMNSANGLHLMVDIKSDNVFEVPGFFTARIHPPYYAREIPMAEGHLEIEIEIQKSLNEVDVANQVGSVFQRSFKLQTSAADLRHLTTYDLSTYEGRSAWGYEAFHTWLVSLSSVARTAISLISGPDYRDILPYLRGHERNGNSSLSTSRLQELVVELDSALERGKIPVPVKLYRASADPYSLEAWTRLSADVNAQVQNLSDSAYTFTSLDETFVQSWNQYELRGQGIIIEVEASAGLRAGYVDRGPQTRDYAEVILARGQQLTPVRAYMDSLGQRRLVVTGH